MKYGCQSMVGKVEAILLKRPEQAFISQENLDKTWEEFRYFGCPDYQKVLEEYNAFEKIIQDNVELQRVTSFSFTHEAGEKPGLNVDMVEPEKEGETDGG